MFVNNYQRHPKECYLEGFCYLKPTKKHSFGCLGMLKGFDRIDQVQMIVKERIASTGFLPMIRSSYRYLQGVS